MEIFLIKNELEKNTEKTIVFWYAVAFCCPLILLPILSQLEKTKENKAKQLAPKTDQVWLGNGWKNCNKQVRIDLVLLTFFASYHF